MSQLAIEAVGLGKRYRIGALQQHGRTFREALTESALAPVRALRQVMTGGGLPRPAHETIWALRDVSFEVQLGEVVGIIGANGAGKSTLLKILTRITNPTEGYARVRGRVGSLLEVGTGFHGELTGRENTYLSGAILGMRRREVDRKFDEIVAFSGVEQFIDTPVKRYSSGMYLRLAFAVAAHLEPDILLVDEVLAVGDAEFQKKCLGKMGDVASQGRTVLFVSHNMLAVQGLCSRAIWLDKGRVAEDGPPDHVIASYLRLTGAPVTVQEWPNMAGAPGNERVRLRRVQIAPAAETQSGEITVKTPFEITIEYWNLQPAAYLNLSLLIMNAQDLVVFNTVPSTEPVWHGQPFPAGLFRSVCRVPGYLLNQGTYSLRILVVENQGTVIYRHDGAGFEVQDISDDRGAWYGAWPGVVRPRLDWTTELLEPLPASSAQSESGNR